ncbi:hypothetical protein PYW07_017312 [Mythimna separata]|uniref:C2H2-type domain-containing protein n=1 Tax=Mythimna separata TaxID=271217 RepID=A0AAD7YXI5_MYTSE|nr:hypothetical protein PYW07_017312 [Mythimna separata]
MDSNNEPVPNLELAIKRSMLAKNKLAMIVHKPNGAVNFSCVECSAMYYDKEELERHLLVHNKHYRYLCGICGTGLKRKEHLDRHTLEHQEVRPYVCPDCGKAFKRKEHMNIHRAIHSGDKSEACPVCSKTFYRKDHLRKHIQTHTKILIEDAREIEDDGYVDVGSEQLVDIKQEIIDEYSRPIVEAEYQDDEMEEPEEKYNISEKSNASAVFVCLVCNKTFKRKEYLKMHSWTHMKKDKVCTVCGEAFHLQDQLLNHMDEHLSYSGFSEEYQQGEPIADPYSSDGSLLTARSVSQYIEVRPYECNICHRRFKRKQHVKVHQHVHDKPVEKIWCPICGQGFLSKELRDRHECAGNEDSEAPADELVELSEPPPCPEVIMHEAKKENKYPQEYMDVAEMAVLHSAQFVDVEEVYIPVPVRVFVCKFCNKSFKRKDHYKIHLHIHTGVKSFFCTECGKGFYRKDHLQKHMLVHSKPKKKKEIPALYPINKVRSKAPTAAKKKQVLPEITIHAPSNTKLRVPLQIKVPYQMVVSMDNGEQHAVTIDPQASPISS